MAELVDALVSNTSAARHAGSIPALGTKKEKLNCFSFFLYQFFFLYKSQAYFIFVFF